MAKRAFFILLFFIFVADIYALSINTKLNAVDPDFGYMCKENDCKFPGTKCTAKGREFYCNCDAGYRPKNGIPVEQNKEACQEINKCDDPTVACDPDTTDGCVPVGADKYYCQCKSNYKPENGKETDNIKACIKQSRCEAGTDNCDRISTECVPLGLDDFTCKCKAGFMHKNGIDKQNKEPCKVCDCGDGNCILDSLGHPLPCVCEGILKKHIDGKCKLCDCGDDSCSLDDLGNPKPCYCTGKFKKHLDGKCKLCDCGDGECELDANGSPKQCHCKGNLKFFFGKCKECNCGEKSRSCSFQTDGGKKCDCFEGYSQTNGTCEECSCGNNYLSCSFQDDGNKFCHCKKGYAQRNGICRATCKQKGDCLNNGNCTYENGNFFCDCDEHFNGDKCEIDETCKPIKDMCTAMRAKCKYVTWLKKATCACPSHTYYDWDLNYCVETPSSSLFITMCIISGFLLLSILTLVIVFIRFRSKLNKK